MPLLLAPAMKELTVKQVKGDKSLVRHLASLGIVPDASLTLLQRTSNSAICQVKASRLALSNEIARMIFVAI